MKAWISNWSSKLGKFREVKFAAIQSMWSADNGSMLTLVFEEDLPSSDESEPRKIRVRLDEAAVKAIASAVMHKP